MTSQLLIRTDSQIKEAFKSKAKAQGVSMDYVLNIFIKNYIEKPDIIQTYIDDDAFDEIIRQSFAKPEAKAASASLFKAIKAA
jgi:antitoxin component of RelBE/YafQ-DinJ toxin-antitoxin module